jgi:Cu(I)/Ag(I) efflux system membrane protein CusA/SilA
MTVMANVFGLLPILLDKGVGSDVAKRIAAPMWGGLLSLTILTLLIIPAVYVVWRSFHLREAATATEEAPPPPPCRRSRPWTLGCSSASCGSDRG